MLHGEKTDMITNEHTPTLKEARAPLSSRLKNTPYENIYVRVYVIVYCL